MSRPTARVLALMEILQAGGTRTVADLAARLGVDERTVRRYVVHLTDLGLPVESVRGRYGGYRVGRGFRLPPLMLTDDEALAVLLGLVAGHRAGLLSTSAVAAESALAKVRRVLPVALGRRWDALRETADFAGRDRPAVELETSVLLRVAEAARDRRPVRITYTTADGRGSERTVDPYGLVVHAGRWYLTGADSASGATRTFRLDRVAALEPQDGTFTPPDDVDPAAQVLTGLAAAPRRHLVTVRVRATTDQVASRLPPGLVVVHELADDDAGWVRVQLHAERLDWVPALLAGMDLPFVVEGPDALRELVRALAARLVAAADAR